MQIFKNYKLEYFTEFYLFQAWTWQFTTLQIYVALWGSWFECVCGHRYTCKCNQHLKNMFKKKSFSREGKQNSQST